ncbi:hypothetical protein EDD86DRAFT_248041 [Gorgonomyces haynaldii]|nr:hypothetical protein EDD86DRAFT_248041 [Gorgonomyces haynaldii]
MNPCESNTSFYSAVAPPAKILLQTSCLNNTDDVLRAFRCSNFIQPERLVLDYLEPLSTDCKRILLLSLYGSQTDVFFYGPSYESISSNLSLWFKNTTWIDGNVIYDLKTFVPQTSSIIPESQSQVLLLIYLFVSLPALAFIISFSIMTIYTSQRHLTEEQTPLTHTRKKSSTKTTNTGTNSTMTFMHIEDKAERQRYTNRLWFVFVPMVLIAILLCMIPWIITVSGVSFASRKNTVNVCSMLGYASTQFCVNDLSSAISVSMYEVMINWSTIIIAVLNLLLSVVQFMLSKQLSFIVFVPLWGSIVINALFDAFYGTHVWNLSYHYPFMDFATAFVNGAARSVDFLTGCVILLGQPYLVSSRQLAVDQDAQSRAKWICLYLSAGLWIKQIVVKSVFLMLYDGSINSNLDFVLVLFLMALGWLLVFPVFFRNGDWEHLFSFVPLLVSSIYGIIDTESKIVMADRFLTLLSCVFYFIQLLRQTMSSYTDTNEIRKAFRVISSNSKLAVEKLAESTRQKLTANFEHTVLEDEGPSDQKKTVSWIEKTVLSFGFWIALTLSILILFVSMERNQKIIHYCQSKLQTNMSSCAYDLHFGVRDILDHGILEWISSNLCAGIIIGCMIHFYTYRRDYILFFSMAFLGSLVFVVTPDLARYTPFTWTLSRLYTGFVLLIGTWAHLLLSRSMHVRNNPHTVSIKLKFAFFWSVAIVGCLAYAAYRGTLSRVLPDSIYPSQTIARPTELVQTLFFVLLLIPLGMRVSALPMPPKGTGILSFYENSVFEICLFLSSFASIACGLHMGFGSTAIMDTHYNIAHFFKIMGYGTVFTGLGYEIWDSMRKKIVVQAQFYQAMAAIAENQSVSVPKSPVFGSFTNMFRPKRESVGISLRSQHTRDG